MVHGENKKHLTNSNRITVIPQIIDTVWVTLLYIASSTSSNMSLINARLSCRTKELRCLPCNMIGREL